MSDDNTCDDNEYNDKNIFIIPIESDLDIPQDTDSENDYEHSQSSLLLNEEKKKDDYFNYLDMDIQAYLGEKEYYQYDIRISDKNIKSNLNNIIEYITIYYSLNNNNGICLIICMCIIYFIITFLFFILAIIIFL